MKTVSVGWVSFSYEFFQVFFKARHKAKDDLNEQLADFQQKRTAGLGTIFGPPECQLDESIHDKYKEIKIVENILIPKLEQYLWVKFVTL